MKVTIILAIIVSAFLALAAALPQIERGSPLAPSGRFAMTQNLAAPPVDLSQPVIFLPEATPITEPPQEPKRTPAPVRAPVPTSTPAPAPTPTPAPNAKQN